MTRVRSQFAEEEHDSSLGHPIEAAVGTALTGAQTLGILNPQHALSSSFDVVRPAFT